MTLSTFGSTRFLYRQNFETATDAAAAGWSFGGASASILSDVEGKFLQLDLGNNNGRSGLVTWGQEIFLNEEGQSILADGTYHVHYEFAIAQGSNNQYNSEFTIFTNHAPITNNLYITPWGQNPVTCRYDNYLFDMSQAGDNGYTFAVDAPAVFNEGATDSKNNPVNEWSLNVADYKTFEQGQWYTVDLDVNVNSREVEYKVAKVTDPDDIIASGTRTVPKTDLNETEISMYAEGLYVLVARYLTKYNIDNIEVYFETENDFANAPTVALTRLGKTENDGLEPNLRAYTISFLSDETLHVTGTDGTTIEVNYDDCKNPGSYVYETTISGTLTAWTTCGDATSEKVETAVDCSPCVLPEPSVAISSVSEGFAKTYTLTVSNKDVPLQPTIFLNYEFTDINGGKISEEGVASGTKVSVTEKGTLKVTSTAFGYESKSITIQNNEEFEVKKSYDFARMSDEQISAAGFTNFEILNSAATNGFSNWTGRMQLFYYDKNTAHVDEESGETVYDKVLPFGFVAEDNTTNVLEYAVIPAEENTAESKHFDGIDVYVGYNLGLIHHIGLYNDQTSKPDSKPVVVKDLDETDFVYVNKMNNYGRDGASNHPIVETVEEYYQQLKGSTNEVYSVAEKGKLNEETGKYTLEFSVYRVDTALMEVIIYAPAGASGSVEGIASEINGDNYWYSIDGVRVAQPTRPGLYIHNGKKIIVK